MQREKPIPLDYQAPPQRVRMDRRAVVAFSFSGVFAFLLLANILVDAAPSYQSTNNRVSAILAVIGIVCFVVGFVIAARQKA